jgi:hypothetical protein
MSRTVYRPSIVLYALWLLASGPAGAADPSSDARDDFDRWIPSLALSIGFTTQEHEGTVNSFRVFPDFGGIPGREFAEGKNNLTNTQVGGSVELQTPQLLSYRWSPRIFIGGEILHVSAQQRPIAREGNPGTLGDDGGDDDFPGDAILGQGSSTKSDADTVFYGASMGVSIPVQIGDWRILIKPSARYLNQELYFQGDVLDAERSGILGNRPPTQTIEIRGNDSLDVHAVGPGLEIEIDAARVGSIAASVFISGGAYNVLSDRKVAFSNRVRDNLDTATYQGNWTAEIEPWIYRANLGFRVKWLGFSSGWLGRGD